VVAVLHLLVVVVVIEEPRSKLRRMRSLLRFELLLAKYVKNDPKLRFGIVHEKDHE
jgi:hypothetical protein